MPKCTFLIQTQPVSVYKNIFKLKKFRGHNNKFVFFSRANTQSFYQGYWKYRRKFTNPNIRCYICNTKNNYLPVTFK